MNRLHTIQQQILSAVYDETALAAAGENVLASDTLDAPAHIAIYRDSIRLGLAHALREIYPVCARLLGDAFFAQVCDQYIQEHPSRSPDLNRYGLAFPEFIDDHSLTDKLVCLPDILRLERDWHKVYSGVDATEFDLQYLSDLTEEQSLSACIILQENMRLTESVWPVHTIWHANRDLDKEPDVITLTEQTVYLLVWRDGMTMHLDVLTAEMWYLLQRFKNGDSLGESCELLEQKYPDAEFSDLFGQVAVNKWIADIKF